MPSHKMTTAALALYATAIDRDDPFLAARMASHSGLGVPSTYDFSRARRQPATIADRFSLVRRRS